MRDLLTDLQPRRPDQDLVITAVLVSPHTTCVQSLPMCWTLSSKVRRSDVHVAIQACSG